MRNVRNRPRTLADPRFHRGSNTQGLMDADEVVVHMEQRQHSDMVFELLTEGIRQPGEPPHVHPHVEILSLNVGRADVLRVWRTDDRLSLGAKTLRRAVTGCSFGIVAINLNQLGEVDILSESIGYSRQIHLVAVCSQLDSIRQPACNVLKELRRTPGIPPSCHPRQYQFALSFNRSERPDIATDTSFHFGDGDVLLLAPDKRPDLVNLHPLGRNVADYAVMVFGASRANGHQQPKDSALGYAGKANRRANRTAFNQGRKDRDFLLEADYVCHNPSIRQRFRIVKRQTKKDRELCGFLGVGPSRLRCLPGAAAALLIGHGFKAALPADSAALGSHLPHNLLDDGKFYGFRQGYGFQGHPAGVLDGIELFSTFASPLWHTSSVTRNAAARQEARNSNRPTTVGFAGGRGTTRNPAAAGRNNLAGPKQRGGVARQRHRHRSSLGPRVRSRSKGKACNCGYRKHQMCKPPEDNHG